ncbi:N-acetylmuramic acid 6-phosphate etherase [Rossellomorea marisflavi]|jgi:N-acetylmuramic acid 6-phosphate etherase|uniref:N-acetylmuramic acid 6-phosphate etherase n=1 Tax=Rossellomorea marisflavi TaxID=189381 RepID=A0A5D4S663_9BACI|nr:N-acetylmuramic acid 6-phosphate etherase [Rossellomorea marisflavi]KQU57536.1 N-acetylmuramic acid 6-phosphate etherase [Bacillus sp. Leaf406]MDR4938969.1 N-acetylmuramic acid 6-phosphate etherase [Rossellomorea marisflavi]MDW4528282.1 N-acetylmuramic acid 6-phosphate etherase [Rossellomorea marisflavi]TYS57206.1 N-acetylmuramic acid 6-phosphate etherase [Rossellomorea marisflavi]UKS64862.1 N-acetylmuramic acid 6-phosphate etherase [Rossellomorea marisflavi]
MQDNVYELGTEKVNPDTLKIDTASTGEVLRMMNDEDHKVAEAVKKVLPVVEKVVDKVVASISSGGRLIYMGAGTSGRLGVLDAVECPPTFSVGSDVVVGLIAGGERAFVKAVEGAEDNEELGASDLAALQLSPEDTVVGIAASGRTPYVIGGLRYAREVGAVTVALSCNEGARISEEAEHKIEVNVGPEALTGSTRLKAGTAQKLVLNMISTASMIKLGKAYGNLMVDVNISNYKLERRAVGIIRDITGTDEDTALKTLKLAHNEVKASIVMIKLGCGYDEAKDRLRDANGYVRVAIEE